MNPHYCGVCEQYVAGFGPWCTLYFLERGAYCRPRVLIGLLRARTDPDPDVLAIVQQLWRDLFHEEPPDVSTY